MANTKLDKFYKNDNVMKEISFSEGLNPSLDSESVTVGVAVTKAAYKKGLKMLAAEHGCKFHELNTLTDPGVQTYLANARNVFLSILFSFEADKAYIDEESAIDDFRKSSGAFFLENEINLAEDSSPY